MTGGAGLIRVGVGFDCGNVFFLVAIKAELAWFFEQESGLIGLVRTMAGSAITVASRVMFKRGFAQALLQIVMALKTEFSAGFGEQLLIVGLMRIMAGEAFAVLDWLMLYLCFGELLRDFLVAFGA